MADEAPIYVPNLKLPSGDELPQVGLGLWKMPNETAADIVYHSIKDGYRLFDGACDYGNEVECGQGIARAIKEGIVKREDVFIVSKLWNSFHDPERVEPICRKQLADWGVDYFDLYLIHFPVSSAYIDPAERYPPGWFYDDAQTTFKPGNATLQQTWQAMEKLVELGLCKNIGVSNYNASLLYDMMQYAKIKPATLQIEHHPYYVQEHLLHYCKEQGIVVTAYSSFGPQSFLDCDMKAAEKVRTLWENGIVNRIAKAHGKTAAQVLLRWATQRGLAVIPKSNTHQRLRENLDVCSFDLAEEEIEELKGLDLRLKFNNPPNYGIPCYLFA